LVSYLGFIAGCHNHGDYESPPMSSFPKRATGTVIGKQIRTIRIKDDLGIVFTDVPVSK
jgi:hypothetical protein